MYQRNSRRCCALMLTVSICLRICMFLGLDAKAAVLLTDAAKSTEFARWMLFLETGQAAQIEEPEQEAPVVVLRMMGAQAAKTAEEPEPEAEPVDMQVVQVQEIPLPSALATASEITVSGGCTYSYDKAALLAQPSTLDFSGDGPQILIVHTHSTEAYTPEAGWEYEATTSYRTLDADHSIIAVGDALAETLEAYGIQVIHDCTLNDYPSYNDSYWTALDKIQSWLTQYPGIQMVIDVHRDAVEDASGGAVALSSTQEGQSTAQLMLVVGTDQGGLSHPYWSENLANALKLQSVLQGQWPGLCRSVDLRTERFNQHVTPGSLLVEVGTNGNTLQQALRSAQLLGEGLATMIGALEENSGTLE